MKLKNRFFSVFGSLFALVLLASCTPPIPPDVLASFAEREVQCANGEVNVAASELASPAVQSSIDLYLVYCPDANIVSTTDVNDADLVLTDYSAKEPEMCSTASVITPIMSKTSTLVYSVSGFDGLVFSPEAVQGIVSGEITNLNDPKISLTNENFDFSDQPITLFGISEPSASDTAYLEWVGRQTGNDVTEVKATKVFDDYFALLEEFQTTEGAFAVLPSNIIFDNVLTYSHLRINDVDVLFETISFGAAASQFVVEEQGDVLKAKLDPNIAPQLDAGQETFSAPWQGISLFDVGMCTADDEEQSIRKFMRFLLRLDNQGQFETFGYFPLTESVRLKAAGVVGKVLPTPTVDPESLG